MDVSPLTSPANTTTASSSTDSATAALASDFETFLTLLTAQMRNQDPLNPQSSSEFVAQLASFSSVEQQIKTNETLDALLAQSSSSEFSDLAGLVGRDVSVAGSVSFDGAPITLDHQVDTTALSPVLKVTNSSGVVVASIPQVPGAQVNSWDGTTDAGQIAPNGTYGFTLETLNADGTTLSTPVPHITRVTTIEWEGDRVQLRNEQGDRFSAQDISAVHEARDVSQAAQTNAAAL